MSGSASSTDSSLLIWLLAAALMLLACHVSLGWVRLVRQRSTLRERLKPLVMAGALLGGTLCAVIVLVLAGESFPFPLGYHTLEVALLCAAALGGGVLLCLLLDRCHHGALLAVCGGLLAVLAIGLQMGWIHAVGFRPGVDWRPEFVAAAVCVALASAAIGLWLAFSELSRSDSKRSAWQFGAAVLVAMGLMAAQELLLAAAGLPMQVGSVYRGEVPGDVLSLVLGLLMPLLLTVLAIDLAARRRGERRSRGSRSFQGNDRPLNADGTPRRRRRRHRTRTI